MGGNGASRFKPLARCVIHANDVLGFEQFQPFTHFVAKLQFVNARATPPHTNCEAMTIRPFLLCRVARAKIGCGRSWGRPLFFPSPPQGRTVIRQTPTANFEPVNVVELVICKCGCKLQDLMEGPIDASCLGIVEHKP